MKELFIPNQNIGELNKLYVTCGWVIAALLFWMTSPFDYIPTLQKVLAAYPLLLKEDFLIMELFSSLKLYGHALLITITISVVASYSTVIPILKPLGTFLSKLRAVSLIGILIVFTIVMPNGYYLKVAILTFCMAPWLITSMNGIIASISHTEYEYARTLKLNEWEIAWHVVIRGKLHMVIESFRQVAIMGIVLLPVAERLSRADGGVGAILASLERFQRLDKIYAVQILILCIAVGQDYLVQFIRDWACPHAAMMEKGE